MRIQKYLSQKNILSRRKTEEYLIKGLIKVNGKVVTELGFQIDPEKDEVELDKSVEEVRSNYIYLAFNKPKGISTNCPQENEREIIELLPPKYKHLNSIGRLDKDSEGLILLTDDGIFAKSILNAEYPHEREYEVWIDIEMTPKMQTKLENGITLFDKKTLPTKIKQLGFRHFKIILREGKNRQIRRMLQKVGASVVNLKRIRFGSMELGNLRTGQFKEFNPKEQNF
jgi:pseudouridine synthase